MLTKYDELFCHQTVSTFDRPETSAREWTERAWIAGYDTSGKFHFAGGFGYYPNRNIMDAFACFTVEGKTQYNVRASRELRPQIDQLKVGPFSYEVVEDLRKVRFALGENEHGLSFDVEIDGTMPPHEEEPQFQISRGRVKENIMRYVQVGRMSGWIKAEGKTYQIDKDKWLGVRDRSWGIRIAGADFVETGTQPHEILAGGLYNWGCMQFDKWGAIYHLRETWDDKLGSTQIWHFSGGVLYPYGSQKEEVRLVSMEHDFEVRAELPQMKSGRVILNAIDGSKIEVSIRPLTVSHMGAGGYACLFEGFIHGLWMGPYWIDGHKLDLTDPNVVREVSGYHGYGCEFRCGNEIGYGTTDLIIYGKYPKYGF